MTSRKKNIEDLAEKIINVFYDQLNVKKSEEVSVEVLREARMFLKDTGDLLFQQYAQGLLQGGKAPAQMRFLTKTGTTANEPVPFPIPQDG